MIDLHYEIKQVNLCQVNLVWKPLFQRNGDDAQNRIVLSYR